MESLIMNYLGDYFDLFLENFDPKRDLNVRLSKADATIQKVDLKKDVIRELIGIETLDVERIYVSNCYINVTPTKITTVPVIVQFDVIDIVLRELEHPKKLPNIYKKAMKEKAKDKKSDNAAKKEHYGTKTKIVDGVCIKVKHLNVVMEMQGDPNKHAKGSVPLLVLDITDFIFQQTDGNWKVVDLSTARKINKNQDVVCVFKEAAMKISAHFVPCFSTSDLAYNLLSGFKLSSVNNYADSTGNKAAGGLLGSTVLLKDLELKVRMIIQRNPKDNSAVGLQFNPIFPKLEVTLNPLNVSMISTWIEAFQYLLESVQTEISSSSASSTPSTPTSTSSKKNATSGSAAVAAARLGVTSSSSSLASNDSEDMDHDDLVASRKSRLAVAFASDQEKTNNPLIVVKIDFKKVLLNISSTISPGFSGFHGKLVLNLEHISVGMTQTLTLKKSEEAYQLTVKTIDALMFTGAELNHMQVLLVASQDKEQISGFVSALSDLHPMYQETSSESHEMIQFSYALTVPCPAPPEYGVNIQGRVRKFEVFVREEDLNFLAAYQLEIQERRFAAKKVVLKAERPSGEMDQHLAALIDMGFELAEASEALAQATTFDLALALLLTRKNTPVVTEPLRVDVHKQLANALKDPRPSRDFIPPYNTFTCLVDINLPAIHFYPRNFFKHAILTLKLPKVMTYANHELDMPLLNETHPLCPSADRSPIFPEATTDYVCKKFSAGYGREVTKMQVITFPFGVFDSTDGRDHLKPLLEFGESQIGIRWDYSASPQFILSVDVSSVDVHLTQEQLHMSYLMYEEYTTNGLPDFVKYQGKMESDFELVDLLDYLPNPSNVKISKSSVGVYDVYTLLPTYLIGYQLRKFSATCLEGKKTVLQVGLENTSIFFEHHTASAQEEHAQTTKRGVAIKFAIQNASLATSLSHTHVKRNDETDPTFALRFEKELAPRKRKLKPLHQGNGQGDSDSHSLGSSKSSGHLTSLVYRKSIVEKKFLQIREFVEKKEIFEKEGVAFHFGNFGMSLNANLFSTMTEFFTSEVPKEVFDKIEELTKMRPQRQALVLDDKKIDLFESQPVEEEQRAQSPVAVAHGEFVVVEEPQHKLSVRDRVQQSVDRLSATIYIMELSIRNLEKSHLHKGHASLISELERPENNAVMRQLLQLKGAIEGAKKERDLLNFLVHDQGNK